MKYLFSLVMATLMGIACMACHPNPANYTVPAGHKTCSGPADCPLHSHCGFMGIDTYPVCK